MMNSEDKIMIKGIYGLTDDEVRSAEKLFNRSAFSICASAKIVKGRRETKFEPQDT